MSSTWPNCSFSICCVRAAKGEKLALAPSAMQDTKACQQKISCKSWIVVFIVCSSCPQPILSNNGHIGVPGRSESGHHNPYLRFFPNACILSMTGNKSNWKKLTDTQSCGVSSKKCTMKSKKTSISYEGGVAYVRFWPQSRPRGPSPPVPVGFRRTH